MKQRPNILLIMADQFRLTSLEGMGDEIHTPNIARIMEKGMVFTQAACTSPLCTPSRASLATGQYPHRCGVIVHDAVLPTDIPTYYQYLRKAGYRVGVAGKTDLHKADSYCGLNGDLPSMYHYGFTDPFEVEGKFRIAQYGTNEDGSKQLCGPYQKFLEERGHLEQISKEYFWRYGEKPHYYAGPSPLPDDEFQDTFIGEHACQWLENVADDCPWHYFVSFAGPHDPWDPPQKYLDRQEGKVYPEPISNDTIGKPEWVAKRAKASTGGMTPEDAQNMKRNYAAAIDAIDEQVGKILDILERRGLADNTVVVFTADHGEMLGDHGLLMKQVMYEGALRIPFVVHCPGMTHRVDRNDLVELMDLAPTFMEMAGLSPSTDDMDARSILPILEGGEKDLRPVQLSELIHTHGMFDGRYKWIRSFNDSDELYDLKEDPQELHNIIHERPEVMKRLRSLTFRQ